MSRYKYETIDSFQADTVTKALDILLNGQSAGSYGMKKLPPPIKESFGVPSIVADFMASEFRAMDHSEIEMALMTKTDDIYVNWENFAADLGLQSAAEVASGWELVFGNEIPAIPKAEDE